MLIKRVDIEGFGKLKDKSYTFMSGINIVMGENESGKTTLCDFIISILFGLSKTRGKTSEKDPFIKYNPKTPLALFGGSLDYLKDGEAFQIIRQFEFKDRAFVLMHNQERVQDTLLDEHLGYMDKGSYEKVFSFHLKDEKIDFTQEIRKQWLTPKEDRLRGISAYEGVERLEKEAKQLLKKTHLLEDRLIENQELLAKDVMYKEEHLDFLIKERKEYKKEMGLTFPIGEVLWMIVTMALGIYLLSADISFMTYQIRVGIIALMIVVNLILWIKIRLKKDSFLRELDEDIKEVKIQIKKIQDEIDHPSVEENMRVQLLQEIKELQKAKQILMEELEEGEQGYWSDFHSQSKLIFEGITQDRLHLFKDENGKLSFEKNGESFSKYQLGDSTLHQISMAHRLSAIASFDEELPILMDNALVTYDDKRLEGILYQLSQLPNQCIIFTQSQREMKILDDLGISYHQLRLV